MMQKKSFEDALQMVDDFLCNCLDEGVNLQLLRSALDYHVRQMDAAIFLSLADKYTFEE